MRTTEKLKTTSKLKIISKFKTTSEMKASSKIAKRTIVAKGNNFLANYFKFYIAAIKNKLLWHVSQIFI